MPGSLRCRNSISSRTAEKKLKESALILKNCSSPRPHHPKLGYSRSYPAEATSDGWNSVAGDGWAAVILPYEKWSKPFQPFIYCCCDQVEQGGPTLVVWPSPSTHCRHSFPEEHPAVQQLDFPRKGDTTARLEGAKIDALLHFTQKKKQKEARSFPYFRLTKIQFSRREISWSSFLWTNYLNK